MRTIKQATLADIEDILSVYDSARTFMRATGNMTQWTGGYPARDVVLSDILQGKLYLCVEDGVTIGVFYYAEGEDPTYCRIYDGAWLNDRPYAVIHRIAVSDDARGRGVARFIFDTCYAMCRNLKIDTHRDNLPMQRALEKNGFTRCGIIHLANGDERVAYQKASI